MHRARVHYDWLHTARMLAMLAEVNRDPKKRGRPFRMEEFHPLLCRSVTRGTPLTGESIRAQAAAWRARQGARA
jgi:hypothetical protein